MSTNTCLFPPQLDDEQLLDYLDERNVHQETAHHLEKCPFCRGRAKALERFQKRLGTRLYRATCPSPMELGEFHLRMLGAPQMLVIGQHLRGCPHCTGEIAQLQDFLDVPTQMENGLFDQVKVLVAQLVHDAGAVPALRGEATRQITVEVDGIVIVLDIQAANEGRVTILGQVAADDQEKWTGAIAELYLNHELQFSAIIDDLGAFRFERVTPGLKELRIIRKDNSYIVMANFEVSI